MVESHCANEKNFLQLHSKSVTSRLIILMIIPVEVRFLQLPILTSGIFLHSTSYAANASLIA